MATTQQFNLPKKAQEAFIQYHKRCYERMNTQWDFRSAMENIDRAYMREQDMTTEHWRAKLSNRMGDSNRIQNVTIPVVKPQVLSAVQYQMAVFLDQYPILGVVAAPQYQDAASQMQALVKENSVRGKWARELMLFFFDGFKYNLSAIECTWDKVVTAGLDTDPTYKGGKEGKPTDVIWSGNVLERWDIYNTYWDTLCAPQDIPSKGEFIGTTKLYTKTALKTLLKSLSGKLQANEVAAFESPSTLSIGMSGSGMPGYYLPILNPDMIINQEAIEGNWDAWMGNTEGKNNSNINYKGVYEVSKEYVRIMPSDFCLDVPAKHTPQVWKLWIVNHSVVIAAERQTNAHEMMPVFFGQPAEDGLGYQTKSLAVDAIPFQQVASALMNSVLASRRRAVNDRVLYDPSRITEAHINNPSPTAKIPIRPSAYGKNVADAVYQFPYRDDQSGMDMQGINTVVGLSNTLNGQNNARQGQFVPGNKTDGQWNDVMSNATSRDRAYSLVYEAQVFTPIKEVLKLNYLQFQQPTSVYDAANKREVQIDPVTLRNAVLNYEVTDGFLPKDKVMSLDAVQQAAQVIGSSPTLAQGYNIAPMFSYLFKTQNVDFAAFEKSPPQLAYEQAVGNWNQLASLAIQKNSSVFQTPQPTPEQFGYNPEQQSPTSQVPQSGVAASSAPGSNQGVQ